MPNSTNLPGPPQAITNTPIGQGNPVVDIANKVAGSIQKTLTVESPETGVLRRKAQQDFNYTVFSYPPDLGDGTRHPYYMTFYINIQDLSKWAKEGTPTNLTAFTQSGEKIHSTVAINQATIPTYAKNLSGTNIGFGRKTSRTKTAIRLYLPDTLSWSYRNSFKDVSLSGIPGAKEGQAIAGGFHLGDSVIDGYMKGGLPGAMAALGTTSRGALGPFIETTLGSLVGDEALALSAFGLAVNPQIDVIYESPSLREFTFEFLFAPRSLAEAALVRQIVHLFKFHSAPEIFNEGGVFGRYFVPPSEFDIQFSIDTLGKISTCVLQDVTIDYATNGTAFYFDDSPVYTRMTLQFKELEFITKNLIEEQDY